jgi:hypothetical protein
MPRPREPDVKSRGRLGPSRGSALGVAVLLLSQACSRLGSTPHASESSLQVRVPGSILSAHAAELPLNLFVRLAPGTLENRGFLLATICRPGSDVVTTYVESLPTYTDLTVWLEGGYADYAGTPCGITVHRRDLIVEGPRRHPQASIRLASGASGSVIVGEPP